MSTLVDQAAETFTVFIEPDFWCPINTNCMCPFELLPDNWFDQSFQIIAKVTLDIFCFEFWISDEFCTAGTIPRLILRRELVFYLCTITRLMGCCITHFTNYYFIAFCVVILQADIANDRFIVVFVLVELDLVVGIVFVIHVK